MDQKQINTTLKDVEQARREMINAKLLYKSTHNGLDFSKMIKASDKYKITVTRYLEQFQPKLF